MALTRPRLQATLACVGTLVLWRWRSGVGPAALAGVAAALALLAWVAPARYAPVQRALDRIIHLDPLARAADPAATSYLRPLAPGPRRFDRQF